MKYIFLVFAIFYLNTCIAQTPPDTYRKLDKRYDSYKEKSITDRRFKQEDIVPLVEKRRANDLFKIQQAGTSIEGRSIYLVQVGTGKTKVLLWSQMHGDESTATMALMDMFNFFEQNDALNKLRRNLLNELSIYVIPMLNPDGAERFQRQNAIGIDLNRDALRLVTPEARILKDVRDKTNAEWGFNLHDQSRYYSAGNTGKPATISFLAPAYNEEKAINPKRADAMKLIVGMNKVLQNYIPSQVAKYSDAFEPRAFGDNIQKWGTRTILIESGGQYADREKQYIRKMNFLAILSALEEIAIQSYKRYEIEDYEAIPFNSRKMYDLLLQKVTVKQEEQSYVLDLAFNQWEREGKEGLYYEGELVYIGDLSTHSGYNTLDAKGYELTFGKTYPATFETISDALQMDMESYLADGYTTLKIVQLPPQEQTADIPLELIAAEASKPHNTIHLGSNPSFFLSKDGIKKFAVINGQLIRIKQ